jgi:TIR domain
VPQGALSAARPILRAIAKVAVVVSCPHGGGSFCLNPESIVMSKVFLSHKQQFAIQAKELHSALKQGAPGATVFQSEDIDKGAEWRQAINKELDKAKCFVMLYTRRRLVVVLL